MQITSYKSFRGDSIDSIKMNLITSFFGLIIASLRLLLLVLMIVLFVSIGFVLFKMGLVEKEFGYKLRKVFCQFAVLLLGIKIIKSGQISQYQGALYVSNHRSLIDAVILFSILDHGYVISKSEVKNYPFIGTGAELSGVVFVERNNLNSRNLTKMKIKELLINKETVIIFPEGTVSIDQKPLPFRKGSLDAAFEANAPVYYSALEYMNPFTDFWFHPHLLKQFLISFSKFQTRVRIHFFDPLIIVNSLEAIQKIESDISLKLNEFQKSWDSKEREELFGGKV